MRIDAVDMDTGKRFTGEADKLSDEDIEELQRFHNAKVFGGTEADVDRHIENLDAFPGVEPRKWADARLKLKEVSKTTIEVGKKVIRLGRKVLDCILFLTKKYPNTTFGLIFGVVAGALISTIPVIGFLIGGLATIIAPLVGAILGYEQDVGEAVLSRAIDEAISRFSNLKTRTG